MKIALAHKRLDLRGGTERDLYQTAEGLRDLGHEVHLFCADFEVKPPPETIAHRLPELPLGRTARLWSLALWGPRVIRRERCDAVVGFGRLAKQDVVRSGGGTHKGFLERLGASGGVRRRLWQEVSPYHRSVLALEARQFAPGHYKRVIAVSNAVKRDIMEHYGVPAERIAVLYNGVDHQRFHPSARNRWRGPIRRQWRIPEDAPLVVFVGSGFRRKGLDCLIHAWASKDLNDAFLLVVGDDARRQAYRALAERQAPGRIIFAGRQDHAERFYAAADLAALPSLQEAFGNVVLEALASGLPVVVSRGAGAAEILRGRLAAGVLDRPEVPPELTGKIAAMLALSADPELRAEARQLGEEFSWNRHFRALESCLMEACQ